MLGKTKILAGALLACLAVVNPLVAQENRADAVGSLPKVGAMAPDFQLSYFDGNDLKKISLEDYRGKKNVVLAFFVFAFTGG